MATSKKGREAPSRNTNGKPTSGDGESTQRRGKNEPGHYQSSDDESRAKGKARNMDSAFNDEDMQGDMLDDYDFDEADGDVDWDDLPARGGGKNPDE